jgi:DNA-binding NarL/FixJ family response regulator
MEGRPVHVVTADGALRRALVARLERAPGLREFASGDLDFAAVQPGDVVISTPADCPPERAHEVARAGAAVIILAAIPRPEEQRRYERAGVAAYIPMLIDGLDLVDAIRRHLRGAPAAG